MPRASRPKNFGSGTHVSEASQRIVALNEAARKAAAAWADAETAGAAAAYTAYIQNFGGGAHVAEARQRVAELDEQARKEARRRLVRRQHRPRAARLRANAAAAGIALPEKLTVDEDDKPAYEEWRAAIDRHRAAAGARTKALVKA